MYVQNVTVTAWLSFRVLPSVLTLFEQMAENGLLEVIFFYLQETLNFSDHDNVRSDTGYQTPCHLAHRWLYWLRATDLHLDDHGGGVHLRVAAAVPLPAAQNH